MSDYNKTNIGSGYNTTTSINTELGKIETAVNSKVDKSGSTMTGDLDMNNNQILNLPDATTAQEPVTLSQLEGSAVGGITLITNTTVSAAWTFEEAIEASGGANLPNNIFITGEQVDTTSRNLIGVNTADDVLIGNEQLDTILTGEGFEVGISTAVTGGTATGLLSFYQNSDPTVNYGRIGFKGADLTTMTIENTSGGDVDVVTSGGQFLVNGSPVGGTASSVALANNVFVTGENVGGTPLNLIGIDSSDITRVGNTTEPTRISSFGGQVNIQGTSSTASRLALLDNASSTLGSLGFNVTDTLTLQNFQANADINLVTNGTGQVLVNGSPIGGGGSLLIPYLSFLQNTDSFSTDQDVLGITTANNWVRLGYDGTGNQGTCFTGASEFWVKGNTSSAAMTAQVKFFSDSSGNPGTQRGYVGYPGSNVLTINNTANVGADVNVATSGSGKLTSNGVPVAFRDLQISTISASDSSFGDAEDFASYTGTGGDTWTMATGMPVGRRVDCVNNGSGTLTIAAGTSRTLHWFDGSAVTTGSRTIAVGASFSIIKYDATNYYITGSGIS